MGRNGEEKERLAERFRPLTFMDEKEPFALAGIGYTVFESEGESPSAPRKIQPAAYGGQLCIEYAYYYDYDIQHLYDLEHLWVYVDESRKVCGCECSFHGMYLSGALPGQGFPEKNLPLDEAGRVVMYVQPGKHAFLPKPELFHLFIDFQASCMEKAGVDGILAPDIVPGLPQCSEQDKRMAERYIKGRFCFVPSEKYIPGGGDAPILPWEELRQRIPERVRAELEKIREYGGGTV